MSIKIVDLSNPFGFRTPLWPGKAMKDIYIERVQFPSVGRPGGCNKQGSYYHGQLHPATHIDAPIHTVDGGRTVDQIPLENCFGTGVCVDMRYKKKWEQITAEDFEKAQPAIQEGDFVVVNTGWHKYWMVKDYPYFNYYPGLVPNGAEWLIKKKVKAITGTWAATDHVLAHPPLKEEMPWLYQEYVKETGKDPDQEFPVYEPCHQMLARADVTCIESAGGDMDQVTGMRCMFAAFPFRLVGSDAAMVRLVAILGL